MFVPKNKAEEDVFAVEAFRVDLQHKLQTVMNRRGVNQKQLAALMSVSEARISQVFSSSCNVTVKFLARAFHALEDECMNCRWLTATRTGAGLVRLRELQEETS